MGWKAEKTFNWSRSTIIDRTLKTRPFSDESQGHSNLLSHRNAFPFLKYSFCLSMHHSPQTLLLTTGGSFSYYCPPHPTFVHVLMLMFFRSPFLALQSSHPIYSPKTISISLAFISIHILMTPRFITLKPSPPPTPPLNSKYMFLILYLYLDISKSFKHVSKWEFLLLCQGLCFSWCSPS